MAKSMIPKRGGARRGPFSGSKTTFTTKITDSTLERLTASAKASEMSISQKGEAALIRGLDLEDDFRRYFAPKLRAFEDAMLPLMPPHDGTADVALWTRTASTLLKGMANDLDQAIHDFGAYIEGMSPTAEVQATGEKPDTKKPAKRRTYKRSLEV